MPADLLLVTPSASLGESIRRGLDETKLYRVHVVNNKASAIVRSNEIGAPIAMLDVALGELQAAVRASRLRYPRQRARHPDVFRFLDQD